MIAKRLLDGLNVDLLLKQIEANSTLWNSDHSWIPEHTSRRYGQDSIVLRHKGKPELHWLEWTKPAARVLTEAWPLVGALQAQVDHELLGLVGITRMAPGNELPKHIDANRPLQFERYQIPLVAEDGVRFLVAGEVIPMKPGEIWWFDKSVEHEVQNDSLTDRLAMVVEIRNIGGASPEWI